MIRSYDKPRIKDSRIKLVPEKKHTVGYCQECKKPLIVLKEFSPDGDLAVCQNENCPRHAQPQKYIKKPLFKSAFEEAEETIKRQRPIKH